MTGHPAEDSQSIAQWGEETFGKATLKSLALRAEEELKELIQAIEAEETDETIGLKAADVAILLHRLSGTLGRELSQDVDQKMKVNRTRKWIKTGDGTGQH